MPIDIPVEQVDEFDLVVNLKTAKALGVRIINHLRLADYLRTTSLRPLPPGESKHQDTRYLDIHEDDHLDEELRARSRGGGQGGSRSAP